MVDEHGEWDEPQCPRNRGHHRGRDLGFPVLNRGIVSKKKCNQIVRTRCGFTLDSNNTTTVACRGKKPIILACLLERFNYSGLTILCANSAEEFCCQIPEEVVHPFSFRVPQKTLVLFVFSAPGRGTPLAIFTKLPRGYEEACLWQCEYVPRNRNKLTY